MLDKIKGGLFGVAIGDALGGTTEFMSPSSIKEKYGMITDMVGGGVWNLEPGETTDDTAMTIAVAKGIIREPVNPIADIGKEFINWYEKKPKDVGIIISNVLEQFNGDWFDTAKNVHFQMNEKSAGNGSLMRCLPIALAYRSLEKVEELSVLQSKMTHYDDLAAEACKIYNKMAWRLLQNEPLKEILEEEITGTRYETVLHEKPSVPSDGFVVNTFMWVLYYLLNFNDFVSIAVEAANQGGDSDTIGAIACGLKGVEVGFDKLPDCFKEKILIKKELTLLAEGLFKIREKNL